MKPLYIIGICLLMCASAHGQKVYTLEECRTLALENNVKMRNARNDVDAALQTKKESFTAYFPNISATGMAFNANTGIVKAELGPDMKMSLLKNGILGGVTAIQPLFAGGQIVNANRLSKVGVGISRIQQELSENEVNLTTEQMYWQIVSLQEKQRTIAAVEKMLDELHKDVEAAVSAGVTTCNDLLQITLKKNEVESNRINLADNLTLCKMVLAQHIGVEASSFEVASPETMFLPEAPQKLYRDPAEALPFTQEHRLMEKNVEANRLQHRLEVGKNLPTIGVGVGYMYNNLMDKDETFGVAFASVSVPISGWWGGSHKIKKQKLKVVNAENELSDKSELLVIKMQQTWNNLQNAWRQIQIAQSSIDQSMENLRLNRDYYQAGTVTMSDLLDAQTLYQQSKDNYVDTYAKYQVKVLEYKQVTGR